MKKTGILTINDYNNYGNRLQNYAMQEVLSELGLDVCTIVNDTKGTPTNKRPSFAKRLIGLLKLEPEEIFFKIKHKFINKKHGKKINKIEKQRKESFISFTKKHISETDYSIHDGVINAPNINEYDYFISGSDQVWNPNFARTTDIDFLTFAPSNKRIAYAPSFGVEQIPQELREKFKEYLNDFKYISIREDSGARIIKELTGKEAPVLVDPTLLLPKEKWLSISKEASNKPKKKYMLTYFLGGVPKDYKKQITMIAVKNKLDIVNLADVREKGTYIIGPCEFIDYINSCSIFCTDSFHGAIFSILFSKPFIVYERKGGRFSMYSRIETLLSTFNLENRKSENIETGDDVFNMDYSHIPPILEEERNKSLAYLKDALNITD